MTWQTIPACSRAPRICWPSRGGKTRIRVRGRLLMALLLAAVNAAPAGAAHSRAGIWARSAFSDLLVATTVAPTLTSSGQSSLWRLDMQGQAVLLLRRQ